MKIAEIEYTPNPNAVKFILKESLTPMGTHGEFHSPEEAEDVPLARAIFEIPHVISLYYTDKWLTVTQDGDANWHELMREVAKPIRDMEPADASLGEGFISAAQKNSDDEFEGVGLDDFRIPMIRDILEDEVLPFLQGDGGGLEIKGLVDNQLLIRYQGACGTCPASTTGTLLAIENLVQMEVDPEIVVVSV
jgi:Fe-S cluster biogenesis protein NfuA